MRKTQKDSIIELIRLLRRAQEHVRRLLLGQEHASVLDLLQQCDMACGIDEVLGSYREYENSLSSNKMKAAKWTWNIYREYLQLGFVKSCWYFINYIYGAVRKRV